MRAERPVERTGWLLGPTPGAGLEVLLHERLRLETSLHATYALVGPKDLDIAIYSARLGVAYQP